MIKTLALAALLIGAATGAGQAMSQGSAPDAPAEDNPVSDPQLPDTDREPDLKFLAAIAANLANPALDNVAFAGLSEACEAGEERDGEAADPCRRAVLDAFRQGGVLPASPEAYTADQLISLLERTDALARSVEAPGVDINRLTESVAGLRSLIEGDPTACRTNEVSDASQSCVQDFLSALREVAASAPDVLRLAEASVETGINDALNARERSLSQEEIAGYHEQLAALEKARSAYTALFEQSEPGAPLFGDLDLLREKIEALERLAGARAGLGEALGSPDAWRERIPAEDLAGLTCDTTTLNECRAQFIDLIEHLETHNPDLVRALDIALGQANGETGDEFNRGDLIWSDEIVGFASSVAGSPGSDPEPQGEFDAIRAALTQPSPQPTILERLAGLTPLQQGFLAAAAVLLLAALTLLWLFFHTQKGAASPKIDHRSVTEKERSARAQPARGGVDGKITTIVQPDPAGRAAPVSVAPAEARRGVEPQEAINSHDPWRMLEQCIVDAAEDKRVGYLVNPESNTARAVSADRAPKHDLDDEAAVIRLINACRSQRLDQLEGRIPALVSLFNRLLAEAQRLDKALRAREAEASQLDDIRAAAVTTAEALDALLKRQAEALDESGARDPNARNNGAHAASTSVERLLSAILAATPSQSAEDLAKKVARDVTEAGSDYASRFSALATEHQTERQNSETLTGQVAELKGKLATQERNQNAAVDKVRGEVADKIAGLENSIAGKDRSLAELGTGRTQLEEKVTDLSAKLKVVQRRVAEFERGEPAAVSESHEITDCLTLADNEKAPEGDRVRALFRVLDSARSGRMSREGVERACIILGEQVFSMLETTGSSGVERAEAARPFMKAANTLLAQANLGDDRLEVFIPRIGDQPDIERMNRPRGRAMTVSDVLGWGLRNDRSVVHKAVVAYS